MATPAPTFPLATPPTPVPPAVPSWAPGPLPLPWLVILMAGLVAGVIIGGLMFARTKNWPTAFLAGLTAASGTVVGVHGVL